MEKTKVLEIIVAKLEAERANLAQAALNTYEAATHEESGAEDQYDTRGLEASYLAGAQAKRVADIDQVLYAIKNLGAQEFKKRTTVGALSLVELDYEGKKQRWFLLPYGGGMTIEVDGAKLNVITPRSPLGEALIGRAVGDVAIVDLGTQTKEYEVLSID